MGWDPAPWMIGGGVLHSTNVARTVSHAAFGGQEGIVSPRDLEVRELAAPGAGVRVWPGTCGIENRATGIRDEIYVGRLPLIDTVDIAPTNAVGGRKDLIVARVENSHMPGEPWDDPADVLNGPYIFTRVIPNVPAGTKSVSELGLGYSAIALARIDLPASTSVVTQGMITDLRRLSMIRRHRELHVGSPTAKQDHTSATFVNFPSEVFATVDVPSWATRMKAVAVIGGVAVGGSGDNGGAGFNVIGDTRIQFTGAASTSYGQTTGYNFSNEGGWDRITLMSGAPTLPVPIGNRGKSMTVRPEGRRVSGSGGVFVDKASMVSLDVEFTNDADTNV